MTIPMSFERGATVGPYEIVMRLGSGGMGEVYRARDPRLGREVAIKVLNEEAAKDRDRLRRFIAEAKAASALNHPNILTVHEIGETAAGPYIVTELVQGSTVRELLIEAPLMLSRALDIAVQTADGIAKAHEAGIVHRDLKPENLMVTGDGFVKILDFGLAKLLHRDSIETAAADQSSTATGMIVGTAGYLSPEQLRGSPTDARSDLFALGVVLYEMATGENPFRRDNPADTFSAILRDEPPPLAAKLTGAPPELSEAVRKALAKRPEERYQSARAFAAELRQIRSRLESDPTQARVLPGAAAGPASRMRPVYYAAGAAALLLVGFLAVRQRSATSLPAPVKLPSGQLAVAVLPIDNQSGDAELEKAGIGKILADAFVQILSDVPKVYVVSPIRIDVVARALGHPISDAVKDPSFAGKVCKTAGANAMLSGKLSRLGKTYILDAELTQLPDTLLGKFRANSQTAEQLLPELTGGISQKIQAKLGTPESTTPVLDRVATSSLRAYEHFVRGYDLQNEGDFPNSVAELKKAIEIDPGMGLAWSFLACAYSFSGEDGRAVAAQEKAEGLLDRVNLKEKRWIQLNGVWVKSKNSSLFRREAERYIRDYPDDREGYFYAGLAAEWLENKCGEALKYYEKAYRLTPTYYPITKGLVDCYVKLNRRDEAIGVLKRFLEIPALGAMGRQQAQGRLNELTGNKRDKAA